MKYTFLSLSVLAFAFLMTMSCGRNTGTLTPINPDTTGDFEYEVQKLKDVSLERTDEVRTLITVAKTSGEPQTVLLSGEDLPNGMEVYFDPINGVDASFNTSLVIKTLRVPEGEYKINIKGASPIGGIKNNYINVLVLPYSNPAAGLVGDFTEKGQCISSSNDLSHNVRVVLDDSVKNRVHIKGMFSGVMTNEIQADINPDNKTLTIPKQVRNDAEFEGDGTYDDDKIIINYTVKATIVNLSCTSTLTRN